MRLCRATRRRGAQAVEAAIVLTLFVTLVLGMIDLGMGVLRYNTVSQAARIVVRRAIVHGSLATAAFGGSWGPTTYTGKGSDGDAIMTELKRVNAFMGLDPSQVTVTIQWLDATNDPESQQNRVQATVTTSYQPMTTLFLVFNVSASSTMPVAH